MSFWNDSRADETRRRWLDGQSAQKIADAFGNAVSRDAVIGKINRMGLVGHREKSIPNGSLRRTPARLTHAKRLAQAETIADATRCDEVRAPTDGVAFVDHTDAMCRWVLGSPADLLYCGAARVGRGPYCKVHDKTSLAAALRVLARETKGKQR